MQSRPIAVSLVLCSVCGCSSNRDPVDPMTSYPVRTVTTWDVAHAGAPVGRVRLLEIEHPERAVRFYRVETIAGQWVGYLDTSGRVYRYEPFETRERFVGVYPRDEALALLFEVDGRLVLTERPRDAVEASTERAP